MIFGKIIGKATTNHFSFKAETEIKKLEYVKVTQKSYGPVLCQVTEIEKTEESVVAKCSIIGYKDEEGKVKQIRIPFDVGADVEKAEDDFIKKIILLKEPEKGAFLGRLEGKDIDVRIDLSTLLTKHVAILAKSGAGKSYTVGVLLEEIMARKVPLLIIDPHGEYAEMRNPNDEEKEKLGSYGLKPKGFKNIKEYGDLKITPSLIPIKLDDSLTTAEVIQLLPGKPSGTQMGILFNALKRLKKINFENILLELEREENNAKWMLVNNLEYLKSLGIFSEAHLSYNEIVSTGVCSIINLKGIAPDVQEIIVYKLLKDLFEARKQNKVPPFFTVIEEGHNYCPERSFGEAKCSKIIRTIASEGRKFGLGLCIVSQRPARVDKSVLSQCTTQIILKVTNPNDLKAISNSVEGITSEAEEEIKDLPIGTALITGITDRPLFVKVRPRLTRHGGHAVNIIESGEDDFLEKIEDFQSQEIIPLIKPNVSIADLKIMNPDSEIKVILLPSYLFICKEKNKEFSLLVEMENGEVVVDVDDFKTKKLPRLEELSKEEIRVLKFSYTKKSFSEEDIIKKGFSLDAGKVILELVKKGLLFKENDGFSLSDKYIFSQLSKNACYHKIEPGRIVFSEKHEKKARLDSVKSQLSKFAEVLAQQECFLVKYELARDKKEKKKKSTEKEQNENESKKEEMQVASLEMKKDEEKGAQKEEKKELA